MRRAWVVVAAMSVWLWGVSMAFFAVNEEAVRVELISWKDAWGVTLPQNTRGDILVPQVCLGLCSARMVSEIMSCEEALDFLLQDGWERGNWKDSPFECPSVLSTWDESLQALQRYLGEASPGVLATPPRSFEVAVDVSATMTRYTYLTRVGANFSVWSGGVALPDNQSHITAIAVGVQHECARRGLQAPPRAILFLWPDPAGACLWKCRHGFMRSPWNSPPPLAGVLTDTRVCRALPVEFTAAEFEMIVSLDYTTPNPQQLDLDFFESLDQVAAQLEAAVLERGLYQAVLALSVPGSVFHDVGFAWVIEQHAFALANEVTYEVLVNQQSTSRRRLLSADLLTVSGVLFTSSTSASPARVAATIEGLNSIASGSIVGTGLPVVIKLHHSTAVSGGGVGRSGGGESGGDAGLALGGVFLAAVSLIAICMSSRQSLI